MNGFEALKLLWEDKTLRATCLEFSASTIGFDIAGELKVFHSSCSGPVYDFWKYILTRDDFEIVYSKAAKAARLVSEIEAKTQELRELVK